MDKPLVLIPYVYSSVVIHYILLIFFISFSKRKKGRKKKEEKWYENVQSPYENSKSY